ncbi:MAG: hypothetical protein JWP32_2838, partial [Schumannella sp.]|nr:hypothetical protein [Schumannella sp.]
MTRHWAMSLSGAVSFRLWATLVLNVPMPASTTIDFSALTAPMPEAEVKQWKIMAKASGAAWATWQAGNVVAVVFIVPFALIFFGILFGFGGFAFDLASASG